MDPDHLRRARRSGRARTWAIDVGDVRKLRPNPYGWIPYVILANNPHPRRFWGRSDLIDLADVAREFEP